MNDTIGKTPITNPKFGWTFCNAQCPVGNKNFQLFKQQSDQSCCHKNSLKFPNYAHLCLSSHGDSNISEKR